MFSADPPTSLGAPVLLSVDFEDWHQLVGRRLGLRSWEDPGPALSRQTAVLLDLLDELGVKATFFVLGMAARAHPELVDQIAERGHEIGCHGDRHLPVSAQSPGEFAADLAAALKTIESITGQRPIGYRAPGFSITRESSWAYSVLIEEGFEYDASQHDAPRIKGHIVPSSSGPHLLSADGRPLWEFPVAVWPTGIGRLPVGGASYWALMPGTLVLRGLGHAGVMPGVYLHPYEFDPEPLRVSDFSGASAARRVQGALRAGQRNFARRRAAQVLRAIASRHPLIPYGEAHARLARGSPARS